MRLDSRKGSGMLRKRLGVFGLLFAVGCCCVGKRPEDPVERMERMLDESEDYRNIGPIRKGWKRNSEGNGMTPIRIHGEIGP